MKKDIKAMAILFCLLTIIFIAYFSIRLFSKNYNEIYGAPKSVNGVLDCTNCDVKDLSVDVNLHGQYDFFYNKWIVSENYEGEPDAIVEVPHRYPETKINGERLSNKGYSSYRMYIQGLKEGTKIYIDQFNFDGGYRVYVNRELITEYGTMVKTGNAKSRGTMELREGYTVIDNNPIEVVVEVSSNSESGLHASMWLSVKTITFDYWLTRESGLALMGVMITLFIFSIAMNFGSAKKDRRWTFSLLLLVFIVQLVFSLDVFWRICEIGNYYIFNHVVEFNYFSWLLMILSFLIHFMKTEKIKYNKKFIVLSIIVYIVGTIFFYSLRNSKYQFYVIMFEIIYTLFAIFPVIKTVVDGKKGNILYLVLVEIGLLSTLFSMIDYLDMIVFGLVVFPSISSTCCAFIVISVYWLIERENSKKIVSALVTESKNKTIRTEALRAQIKPHFIFNSLTNIQNMYNQNNDLGNEALTRFSKHLRTNIEAEGKDLIPFASELNNILNYAELENMRRQKKINLLLDCEEYDFEVPILSLQPFLENAFKYSLVEEKEEGYVEIKSYKTEKGYIVEINDNGVGFDQTKVKTTSIGLRNAKERLKLISNAEAIVVSQIGGGTRISILFRGNEK